MVAVEIKLLVRIIVHTIRDAFDLSGRSIAPSYGVRNRDIIARGVYFDNVTLIWRIHFASRPQLSIRTDSADDHHIGYIGGITVSKELWILVYRLSW